MPFMMESSRRQETTAADATYGASWRDAFSFHSVEARTQCDLLGTQNSRMNISSKEEDLDILPEADDQQRAGDPLPVAASFAEQDVYALPSAYIASLVKALPSEKSLTSDQTAFVGVSIPINTLMASSPQGFCVLLFESCHISAPRRIAWEGSVSYAIWRDSHVRVERWLSLNGCHESLCKLCLNIRVVVPEMVDPRWVVQAVPPCG